MLRWNFLHEYRLSFIVMISLDHFKIQILCCGGGEYLESNRILIFEDMLLELTNILSHSGGGVGGQQ